jgi:hypothetical protein
MFDMSFSPWGETWLLDIGTTSCVTFQIYFDDTVDAKRVLKYFKGTQDFGFRCSEVDEFNLIRYSNSDFVGHKENGVSTSCYLMSLGLAVVSWRSCKQLVPVDSTTEAEYVVVVEEMKKIV